MSWWVVLARLEQRIRETRDAAAACPSSANTHAGRPHMPNVTGAAYMGSVMGTLPRQTNRLQTLEER
jgi:hypothetical protein